MSHSSHCSRPAPLVWVSSSLMCETKTTGSWNFWVTLLFVIYTREKLCKSESVSLDLQQLNQSALGFALSCMCELDTLPIDSRTARSPYGCNSEKNSKSSRCTWPTGRSSLSASAMNHFPLSKCLFYDSCGQKCKVGRPFYKAWAPGKPRTNVHSEWCLTTNVSTFARSSQY